MKWIKFVREDTCEYYSLDKLITLEISHIGMDDGKYKADFHFNNSQRRVFLDDKKKFMRNFENFVLNADGEIFELEF